MEENLKNFLHQFLIHEPKLVPIRVVGEMLGEYSLGELVLMTEQLEKITTAIRGKIEVRRLGF